MPLTPFHFGVGLLIKGAAPSRTSFLGFCASQVVIDLETAVHILRREWPVHRALHTFLVAVPAGALTGALVWFAGRLLRSRAGRVETPSLMPALVGGILGGLTHPFLDGIMHGDIQPLWPFRPGNPFYQAIGTGALHVACVACAIVGGALLAAHARRPSPRGRARDRARARL